jgi:hypothetical protein
VGLYDLHGNPNGNFKIIDCCESDNFRFMDSVFCNTDSGWIGINASVLVFD